MAVWLFAGVPAKDYERAIVAAARDLRTVKTADEFDKFVSGFFDAQKREHVKAFRASLRALKTWDVRQFRLKSYSPRSSVTSTSRPMVNPGTRRSPPPARSLIPPSARFIPSSKFLLSRCQQTVLQVGVNDKITEAMKRLDPAPTWSRAAVEQRQRWFSDVALDVWNIRRLLTEPPGVDEKAAVTAMDA